MKLHTDTISPADLQAATPTGCHLEAMPQGSRSRAYSYAISLCAKPGNDAHGVKRRNQPSHITKPGYTRAATWNEWGDMFAHLFTVDPEMKAGQYDGASSFIRETTAAAEYRQDYEHAPKQAARWAAMLERS